MEKQKPSRFKVFCVTLVLLILALGAIDWGTSFLIPRPHQYVAKSDTDTDKEHASPQYYEPYQGGVIIEAGLLLSEIKPEWWTATATIALAAFTLFLWLATERLWAAGDKQLGIAKEAADAAKKSADALPLVERGYVFFRPIDDTFANTIFSDWAASERGGQIFKAPLPKPVVKIVITNWGRTAAAIDEIRVGIFHVATAPTKDNGATQSATSLRFKVFPPTVPTDFDITAKQGRPSATEYDELDKQTRWYFVQGRITYRVVTDTLDALPRETSFCWRYNFPKRHWAEYGGDNYNRRT